MALPELVQFLQGEPPFGQPLGLPEFHRLLPGPLRRLPVSLGLPLGRLQAGEAMDLIAR